MARALDVRSTALAVKRKSSEADYDNAMANHGLLEICGKYAKLAVWTLYVLQSSALSYVGKSC